MKPKRRISWLLSVLWLMHHSASRWWVCCFPGLLLIIDLWAFQSRKEILSYLSKDLEKRVCTSWCPFLDVWACMRLSVFLCCQPFQELVILQWQEWRKIQPISGSVAKAFKHACIVFQKLLMALLQCNPNVKNRSCWCFHVKAGICFSVCRKRTCMGAVLRHSYVYFLLHFYVWGV